MKHGHQTVTILHNTYCRQDPHEAWSPDSNNITQHILSTRPARSMVARQQQQYYYVTLLLLQYKKSYVSTYRVSNDVLIQDLADNLMSQ